jgi:hypothetical protein
VSTFLELVQDLHRESGAGGAAPTSVIGQTGEANRLVGWIREGDTYIQNLWLNWKFLWNQVTLMTATGIDSLSPPSDLLFWDYKTFKLNDPSIANADDQPLNFVEHDSIKWLIRDTQLAEPSTIILMPDNSIEFEPVPDKTYDIKADYFREPTLLAANSDVSAIPGAYHPAILGRALILYSNFENAPEIRTQGQEIYGDFLPRLENNQLPNQRYSRYQSTGSFFDVNANQGAGGVGDGSITVTVL